MGHPELDGVPDDQPQLCKESLMLLEATIQLESCEPRAPIVGSIIAGVDANSPKLRHRQQIRDPHAWVIAGGANIQKPHKQALGMHSIKLLVGVYGKLRKLLPFHPGWDRRGLAHVDAS